MNESVNEGAFGAVGRYGLLKKKDGTLLQNPPEDHMLEDGDRVVALSRSGASVSLLRILRASRLCLQRCTSGTQAVC